MPRTSDKRERLIDAAKQLIYQQGMARTTLADIAEASSVPLGNVYYYFKTKEDLAAAVIAERKADIGNMLSDCGCAEDPRGCLIRLLENLIEHAEMIADRGCPVGSLCQELGKTASPLTDQADDIIRVQLDWVTEQYRRLGVADPDNGAAHLLASIHGTFVTGQALKDPALIRRQFAGLIDEVKAL